MIKANRWVNRNLFFRFDLQKSFTVEHADF